MHIFNRNTAVRLAITAQKEKEDKPDKILQRRGVYVSKGEEDFANTGSDSKACMFCIVLEVLGEEM